MAEKPAGWVDYEAVKKVPFDWALKRLDLFDTLTPSGEELKGVCPIPAHTGEKKKETFYVNVGKGMFTCHQCKKRGNVLDFVMALQDVKVRKQGGGWHSSLRRKRRKSRKVLQRVRRGYVRSNCHFSCLMSV